MDKLCNVMLDGNELELLLRLVNDCCNADGSQMHKDLTNKLKCAYNICMLDEERNEINAEF